MAATQFLERPGGRLAYEIRGQGPLVVCSPGLGDLRGTYDQLAELLVPAGFKVVTVDLRGLGDSSVFWPSYSETDSATDLLAVIQAVGAGPAIIVGCDFSGAAAVVAAASQDELVNGLVLSGQKMRDYPTGVVSAAGRWLVTRPGIGRVLWNRAWPWLFGPRKPSDFEARRRAVAANLAEPGRYDAVRAMLRPGKQAFELVMPYVTCPALVVMGDADPTFANVDPEHEARYVASRLGGPTEVLMVRGAGYYPHAEQPQHVASVFQRWWATNHQLKLLGND